MLQGRQGGASVKVNSISVLELIGSKSDDEDEPSYSLGRYVQVDRVNVAAASQPKTKGAGKRPIGRPLKVIVSLSNI